MKPVTSSPSTSYRPRAADELPSQRPRLPASPAPPFELLAHPESWDVAMVAGTPQLVPNLCRFEFRPGRNGVRARKGSAIGDAGNALVERVRRGWVRIPRTTGGQAWGEAFSDYCVAYDGELGTIHVPVWERLEVIGRRVVTLHDDDPGFDAWRAGLVDRGVLSSPSAAVLAATRQRLVQMIARRSRRDGRGAELTAELLRERLQVFDVQNGRVTLKKTKPTKAKAEE